MAQDDSKFNFTNLNFFNRLDARARILVLVGAVLGLLLLVYLGTRWFAGGSKTVGPSRVANAPQGLQSVPGGQLTPEYYRALMQANTQAATQAQMSGGSAIPTLVNIGNQTTGNQCIVCSDQNANVKTLLDDWIRQGKVTPETVDQLTQLANRNVPVEEYAAALDRLVREGKLTPEQARALLEQYKKQHANALIDETAKSMDPMIKTGQLPLEAANQLLAAQRNGSSPSDYARELQRLVAEGKISPETAQRLLSQYTQQFAREVTMRSIATLNAMGRRGEITPDVLKELINLENQMVAMDLVASTLQKYVAAGKLTPIVSQKILEEYKQQKAAIGPGGSINEMLQRAESAAYLEISDLLKAGKMTPDVAALLTDMIQKNVPLDTYKTTIAQLVQQNKMTPEIAKLKIGDYTKVRQLRDEAQMLAALQANNATSGQYADELKKAVQNGALTPEEAAQLLQEYQGMTNRAISTPIANTPGSEAFAALQQRVQQGNAAVTTTTVTPAQFAAVQTTTQQVVVDDSQARIQALMAAMSGQAQQLIAAWQPPVMQHKGGGGYGPGGRDGLGIGSRSGASTTTVTSTDTTVGGIPLIKAGTIIFGVLDTAVNSDYPDSPVLVTIVQGPFKGAKLLGKLTTTKSVSGQMDRIMLNFSLMNKDEWVKSKSVTAYAIDPDTARTVLATSVNYHYLMRFGAIMATSFLQGFSTSITNAGTSTTGIFGTSTTHPTLGTSSKIWVGLGQVGQTLGTAVQNYINIPPTVRVEAGVSLGILFMADVI